MLIFGLITAFLFAPVSEASSKKHHRKSHRSRGARITEYTPDYCVKNNGKIDHSSGGPVDTIGHPISTLSQFLVDRKHHPFVTLANGRAKLCPKGSFVKVTINRVNGDMKEGLEGTTFLGLITDSGPGVGGFDIPLSCRSARISDTDRHTFGELGAPVFTDARTYGIDYQCLGRARGLGDIPSEVRELHAKYDHSRRGSRGEAWRNLRESDEYFGTETQEQARDFLDKLGLAARGGEIAADIPAPDASVQTIY